MARGIVVPIIGDPDSVLRAINKTIEAGDKLGVSYKKVGVTAEESARLQIEASTKKEARLRNEVAVYRQIASTAARGSKEQVTAANLATESEKRLARSLSVTAHESSSLGASTRRAERDFGRATRGALAGSGVFRGLGRSIAFASGGFLAFASVGQVVRSSIDAATEALATQRQLAAQFKASGVDLSLYRKQIEETGNATSALSGFTRDDLTQAFITAFRGSKNVAVSLKEESIAANVARGRHIGLAQSALALAKAYGGQVTALRRLGIQVPSNLKGMQALDFVAAKFAGQARAGSTAQERFGAELHNTEETIGTALLPTLNKYLDAGGKWLAQSKNQARIQQDVQKTAKVLGQTFAITAKIIGTTAGAVERLNRAFDKLPGHSTSLRDLFNKIPGHQESGLDALKSLFGSGGEKLGAGSKPLPAGQPPIGENALNPARSEVSKARSDRLGLLARFAKADLALAKAQRTKITSDDRAALQVEAAIVKDEIASRKKVFKDKTALERQLGSIEDQIDAIDKAKADARTAAATARKQRAQDRLNKLLQGLQLGLDKAGLTKGLGDDIKAAQAQVAALKQQVALNKTSLDLQQQLVSAEAQLATLRDQQLANQKAARQKQLDAAKKARDEFVRQAKEIRDVIQTERDRIGVLFAGPVFNPSDAQQKRALGAPTPGADAKKLIADLKGQIQQFRSFERDLRTLQRRGAPLELLNELRQQGFGVAPQVHALATAGGSTLAQFKSLFLQRERLAVSTAKQEQRINIHFDVHVVRGTGEVKIVRTTPHGQKRGNNPGVIVNPVNPGRP